MQKRRLYTTKVSWCLQSAEVCYLYYVLKITKIYVKNITSKNTSINEIKDIRIQFSKTLSNKFYEAVFFFLFKTFKQQLNLMPISINEFFAFIQFNSSLLFNNRLSLKCSIRALIEHFNDNRLLNKRNEFFKIRILTFKRRD